ncbi:MAG: alanine--glyoxylate aminotransferase family protein [Gemmatimonadales bacterium]
MTETHFGRFFLPGPTEVRAAVLQAMLQPMMPHRGAAFEALYARLQVGLKAVFRTTQPVFISTSSATGMMEAAVRCTAPGTIVAMVNGAFSARFAHIVESCGREVDVLKAPLGESVSIDAVRDRLQQGGVVAVLVVHSETSTGVRTDVRAVSDLAHEHGAMCLIDSVTGVGGIPVEFDDWGLDFVLTGSQKALALPPGLAFAAASPDFMDQARASVGRGVYFDLVEFAEFHLKNQTPSTPALSLLYALDCQLEAIMAEGMEARWARHQQMADRTHAWADELGAKLGQPIGILAPARSRAQTVSAITLPEGVTGPDVVRRVAETGYTIGAGYGALKDTTIRIGHMGDHSLSGLEGCLDAVKVEGLRG